MARILISIILLLLSVRTGRSSAIYPERAYQEHWCGARGGTVEYVLIDRTRVDCLTPTHAVEFDFAEKWAEAIGQSLYYARSTGHAPAVVLIVEDPAELRFLGRFRKAAEGIGIEVWVMTPGDLVSP